MRALVADLSLSRSVLFSGHFIFQRLDIDKPRSVRNNSYCGTNSGEYVRCIQVLLIVTMLLERVSLKINRTAQPSYCRFHGVLSRNVCFGGIGLGGDGYSSSHDS
jgi:hypothetical protein